MERQSRRIAAQLLKPHRCLSVLQKQIEKDFPDANAVVVFHYGKGELVSCEVQANEGADLNKIMDAVKQHQVAADKTDEAQLEAKKAARKDLDTFSSWKALVEQRLKALEDKVR